MEERERKCARNTILSFAWALEAHSTATTKIGEETTAINEHLSTTYYVHTWHTRRHDKTAMDEKHVEERRWNITIYLISRFFI